MCNLPDVSGLAWQRNIQHRIRGLTFVATEWKWLRIEYVAFWWKEGKENSRPYKAHTFSSAQQDPFWMMQQMGEWKWHRSNIERCSLSKIKKNRKKTWRSSNGPHRVPCCRHPTSTSDESAIFPRFGIFYRKSAKAPSLPPIYSGGH